MNMVRCMLGEKNVPKNFWPEAVNWSVHILNRCPIFAVKDMTLEEAWSGNKPSVRHFKVFGCIAYVHIPDNLRKKLDDKSIVCVHLGLSEESKAYKLYDPIKRKILVRKDVKFDEVNQLDWENKKIEKTSTVIDQVDVETCSSSKHSESGDECDDHASDTHEDNVIEEVPDSEDDIDEPELGKRISRRPPYLDDFVTDEINSRNQALHNLAIFTPAEDPTTYDEASKH
ncbi:hypothetical protein A2U01_0020754, partial [Trifolium medium]|nr:hypothetical protein [Trifolium medium]MCH99739.1 hypothetical protein [Trifolium medium]